MAKKSHSCLKDEWDISSSSFCIISSPNDSMDLFNVVFKYLMQKYVISIQKCQVIGVNEPKYLISVPIVLILTPFEHGISLIWEADTSIHYNRSENWLTNRREERFQLVTEVNSLKFHA